MMDKSNLTPAFSSDLATLVWPMPKEEFISSAMHNRVLFQSGSPSRLELFEKSLAGFDLRFLLAHGEDGMIWREGGLKASPGMNNEMDINAFTAGVTIQTHLNHKSAFGRKFLTEVAQQMHLESGFFSIFASQDSYTATHYDRNYNFTIQLVGQKTWTVHEQVAAVVAPTECIPLEIDRLTQMSPEMHGAPILEPAGKTSEYTLSPGDLLYVPPGYWHATQCSGVSISLNLSIEPLAWYELLGRNLLRHLKSDPQWRLTFGSPSYLEANTYLEKLKHLVHSMNAQDLINDVPFNTGVSMDQPLRRTLGSLLMWETTGAGIYFHVDEVRFSAQGKKGRLSDLLSTAMLPVLEKLAHLEHSITLSELCSISNQTSH